MAKFNQQKFNQFIIENNVVGFFQEPITLKSGRISHCYVNWRNVSNDVFLMDQLTDFVLDFIEDLKLKPDCFYGVPEGATKLAIFVQYKWAKKSPFYGPSSHILAMGRGKFKDHGEVKDRFFIGVPKGKVIVLEDVTTTGQSLLEGIETIKKIQESKIIAAIGLTNRMEKRNDGKSVKEAVEQKGVPYFQMSKLPELLPLAYQKIKPPKEIAQKVEKEFQEYGLEKVKLLN